MKAHHVLGNTVSIQKAKRPIKTNFVTSDIKIIISNDRHSHMNMTFKIHPNCNMLNHWMQQISTANSIILCGFNFYPEIAIHSWHRPLCPAKLML